MALAALAAPEDAVAEALTGATALLPRHTGAPGCHPYGLPDLRAAVADRFPRTGLPTLPDEVLITSGAQQALALVLALLGRPGDRAMAENPSYPTHPFQHLPGQVLREEGQAGCVGHRVLPSSRHPRGPADVGQPSPSQP
ncbi:aminotransferase class I/II-fold pyridoxal phosphate-dependent enzyme [Streptomyces sp. R39]|uniref:Aminotransferase class I/II-fold pyridoxal phosphate-dependent enzyme n=1 Tax=Streptomyces sp. R39 TaxID=3238631 RepID=A0AB39R4L7_9ACTN